MVQNRPDASVEKRVGRVSAVELQGRFHTARRETADIQGISSIGAVTRRTLLLLAVRGQTNIAELPRSRGSGRARDRSSRCRFRGRRTIREARIRASARAFVNGCDSSDRFVDVTGIADVFV